MTGAELLAPILIEALPIAVERFPQAYCWLVARAFKKAIGGLEDAAAEQLLKERLQDWSHQKTFARYYLKFVEQPPKLREHLCVAFGALSLAEEQDDFAERLWQASRLVDDLPFRSLASLRDFAVAYTDLIDPNSSCAIRRLECEISSEGSDGRHPYRLLQGDDPPEQKSDWFELDDHMVEGLVAHLGIREGTGHMGFSTEEDEQLVVGRTARFMSADDETVQLIREVFDLADHVE